MSAFNTFGLETMSSTDYIEAAFCGTIDLGTTIRQGDTKVRKQEAIGRTC
jgi:hypothetical protein